MSSSRMISAIEKGYPITRFAQTIPKVQSKIVSWKADGNGMVGLSLGASGQQFAHGDSLVFIQKHVHSFLIDYDLKILVPQNALTVSLAMDNFKVGKSCQEFVPINRIMPESSFFSYQMLSKHCQATYYNENGVRFLAGICYYVQLRSSKVTADIDQFAMSLAVISSDSYPLMNRWDSWRFTQYRNYGRDCKTAGKRVVVEFKEGKDPMHVVYNYRMKKLKWESCEECKEEAKTYKFVNPGEETAPSVTPAVTQKDEKLDEDSNKTKKPATVTQVVEKLEELKVEELTKKKDEKSEDKEPATMTQVLDKIKELGFEEKTEEKKDEKSGDSSDSEESNNDSNVDGWEITE